MLAQPKCSVSNKAFRLQHERRGGTATVELALVLPVLLLFALMTVDMGRFGKFQITAANAAHNGALYASQNTATQGTAGSVTSGPIYQAVMNDINNNLEVASSKVTITEALPLDGNGAQAVEITVNIEFDLMFHFGTSNINYAEGFKGYTISEKCRMRVRP